MDSRPTIELPPELVEMSTRWAQQVVADYAAGRNANSRAVTCFDAHSNIELQAKAKMAECAFALWAGADPKYALHWGRTCDDGADFTWRGKRWDVKATSMRGRYLIWPIGKNHIYDSKKFDCLALVKCDPPMFLIAGWMPKAEFLTRKKIADASHLLVVGTWNVHEDELWGPQLLKPDDYDGQDDLTGSLAEGYRYVRERIAAGGRPWVPK